MSKDVAVVERELEETREALAEAEHRLQCLAADLANERRRFEEELARKAAQERGRVLGEWLDVLDALDRALESAGSAPAASLREGLTGLHREAAHVLERLGVRRLTPVGEAFDPTVHEAVERSPGGSAGRIAEEVRAGFVDRDGRLLRPARVVVHAGD